MDKANFNKSVVNPEVYAEFEEKRGTNLFNHSANSNYIEDFISVAYVLCPEIVDVNGYVFIADFYQATGDEAILKLHRLEAQFSNDKKQIEQWVNSWSFGDFFIGKYCTALENEIILRQFGDILVYYWSRRVQELFPNRKIIVEYGDGLMGEAGLAITMYQK